MEYAIILLGGSSLRTSTNTFKQYFLVDDKEVFLYSFERFYKNENIDKILLVVDKDHVDFVKVKVMNYENKEINVIEGGDTRKKSVFNALNFIASNEKNTDSINVLIHDAARPLVTTKLINRCVENLKNFKAITPVIPNNESLCVSQDGLTLENYQNRNITYTIQTPQCFNFEVIFEAHQKNEKCSVNDDTELVKLLGYEIHLIEGDQMNFKLTTYDDLMLFRKIVEG